MSQTVSLPPMFRSLQLFDKGLHAGLRLDGTVGFGAARELNAIPLALGELATAALHFPIVLVSAHQAGPAAVVGYRNAENIFLEPDGSWAPGAYVPAYLRAYPFLVAPPRADSTDLVVMLDPEAEMLSTTEGELLLQDGAPAPVLQERLSLCRELRASLIEAGRFAAALQEAGLLQEQQAMLEFNSGEKAKLDGFQTLDPAKLQALPEATVVEWHRNGWLAAIHAIQFSAARWGAVMERAARRG